MVNNRLPERHAETYKSIISSIASLISVKLSDHMVLHCRRIVMASQCQPRGRAAEGVVAAPHQANSSRLSVALPDFLYSVES